MRISRWTLTWVLIVAVLAVIELGILMGWITPGNLVVYFYVFVYAIVLVAILAIIGAVFLGTVISHRIMSGQAFTPFEEEMLKMRQEVRELHDRMDALLEKNDASRNGPDHPR